MALLKYTEQASAAPETKGKTLMTSILAGLGTSSNGLKVISNVVSFGGGNFTYTALTGTVPTEQELFDLWAPLLPYMNGTSSPNATAPTVVSSDGNILYPAFSPGGK